MRSQVGMRRVDGKLVVKTITNLEALERGRACGLIQNTRSGAGQLACRTRQQGVRERGNRVGGVHF